MRTLRPNSAAVVLLVGLLIIGLITFFSGSVRSAPTAVDFPTLMQKVDEGQVKDVKIAGQAITGHYRDDTEFTSVGPEQLEPVYNRLVEHGVTPSFEPKAESGWFLGVIGTVLPIVLMGAMFFWFFRNLQQSNGRAMSFGKARARMHGESNRRVTFEDVAGIDESKEDLEEIIDFLRDRHKFTRLGGRIPRGVLLMGPPGTGKTLLAKAVAGEAGVPFFSIAGSDFVELYVGVGASRVRDLFEQGRKNAPCIIFIDEIDAVGRNRGGGAGGGQEEREQTLNQLLVEMDGFEGTEGVIVMAATNRADVLDAALLRPGRFDRRITVPAPDVRGRLKILQIHTRRTPLGPDVDLDTIARITPGTSGADLENLCNEAALLAARHNKKHLEMADFEKAREKIAMGPERRSMVMPESEKKMTAYHEAGHAIVAHLLPGYDPVHKVTIVPRGRALGLTWTVPEEDRHSWSKPGLLKLIVMAMGGRAAEEVALNQVTGGAQNDIEQATRIARAMVMDLGMSEDLGPLAWGERQESMFLPGMARVQTYSEHTARRIDQEVRDIVSRAHDAAKRILSLNIHVLHRVAQALIDRETLDREEFAKIVEEARPIQIDALDGLQWIGVQPTPA
jgi:cell division protease FtsH